MSASCHTSLFFLCSQAQALSLINTIVQISTSVNSKVYYQEEFIEAGLDPSEVEQVGPHWTSHDRATDEPALCPSQLLHRTSDERVSHELSEWRKGRIDVQELYDKLAIARGKIRGLEEDVRSVPLCVRTLPLTRPLPCYFPWGASVGINSSSASRG